MDKMTRYRELIKKQLGAYIELENRHPDPEVRAMLVADDERGQYMWVRWGWTKKGRVRAIVIYVRLENDKIWIEEDWTEDGIATDLVRAGVPKEDIVLGFQPPEMRPYTDFAAA
jgi:hypothetical protein